MKYKFIGLFTSLLMVMGCIIPVNAKVNVNTNNLYSEYAYVYDNTGDKVLYDHKGEERMFPASMTKVLTVYSACKRIKDINESVTIDQEDVAHVYEQDASSAGFVAGEKLTYKDLLYGALYPSGADACWALGRLIAGSEKNFVKLMNQDAKALGMKDSHFVTSTGLHDDKHYTTCKDISMLLKAALQNKIFRSIFTGDNYYTTTDKRIRMMNTLTRTRVKAHAAARSELLGAKSGYTSIAGHCLVSLAKVNGHEIITTTAKAFSTKFGVARFSAGCAVLDHNVLVGNVKDQTKNVKIMKKNELVNTIKIRFGEITSYKIKTSRDLSLLLDKNFAGAIKVSFKGKNVVQAPVNKGDVLGKIIVSSDGQTLYSETVKADRTILFDYKTLFIYVLKRVLVVLAILIVLAILLRIRKHKRKKRYQKYRERRKGA